MKSKYKVGMILLLRNKYKCVIHDIKKPKYGEENLIIIKSLDLIGELMVFENILDEHYSIVNALS